MPPLDVLYEDNHLLVVNKPAGIPTQGAASGDDSLVVRAKTYLKRQYAKPGNVFVGVVSRLDALVSGVVVLARTSKAAARLSAQFRESDVLKTYWAVVQPSPRDDAGQLVDWVLKNDARHRMEVVPPGSAGSQEARLDYRVLQRLAGQRTLLQVNLQTGRKHQIRVQLAHRGWPIVGDRKYGSLAPFPEGIALHARRLAFDHPTRKERLTFSARLPANWQSVGLNEDMAVKIESRKLQ